MLESKFVGGGISFVDNFGRTRRCPFMDERRLMQSASRRGSQASRKRECDPQGTFGFLQSDRSTAQRARFNWFVSAARFSADIATEHPWYKGHGTSTRSFHRSPSCQYSLRSCSRLAREPRQISRYDGTSHRLPQKVKPLNLKVLRMGQHCLQVKCRWEADSR